MKMSKNKISRSVLEKCGITIEIIKNLKKKEIVIPDKIKPVKEPLRSPSEEWFYSIADRFTPPLTSAEKEVFMNFPHLLSLQISKSVDLMFEVSSILYEALEKVKENLKGNEAVAAVLAILRVFHGCFDYNYLKYDRHLEYHQYKESPVGYYWNKLKEILLKAAKNLEIRSPDHWVNQKILEIISGPRRTLLSSEYAICCKHVYDQLKTKIPNLDNLSSELAIERLKKDLPEFFKIIRKYSESFYRLPEEFVKDCVTVKNMDPYEEIMKRKKMSIKTIEEVKSKLTKEQSDEFERIIEIIEDFLSVQELEGFIATGVRKNIKNRLLDVLIEGYDQLHNVLISNMELVKPEHRKAMNELLKAKDIPSKFIADRKLVSEGEHFFNRNVEQLYLKEIERWR